MYNLKFTSPVRPSVPTLPASSLGGVLVFSGCHGPGVIGRESGIGVLHPTGVPGILDMVFEGDWLSELSEFTHSIETEENVDS